MVKLRERDDGSLVFEEGWHDFVLKHSVSVGEIVVFKHISIALFTVQIYGTSGCERMEFQGKENDYSLKRKRTKNETTPIVLCQNKARKSYETSQGKHKSSVKESSKKDAVDKAFPCRLAGNETAVRKYVTRSAREHSYSPEESPHRDDGHRKLHNSSTMSHSEAPNKIIDRGKKIEESGINSPIVLSDDDGEEMEEVIMIKDYSYVDKSNGGAKSSSKEHFRNQKENLTVDKRSANRCFLTTERKSSMMPKEVMQMTPNASVYSQTSQVIHSLRSTNISAANEQKMSAHEKAVSVEHEKGVAGCDESNDGCLSALDKKRFDADKLSVCKQEVTEITPIISAPHQMLETGSSQDANRLGVNEESTKDETRVTTEDNCEVVVHTHADERLPAVGCSQGQNIAVEGQVTNDKIIINNGSKPEEFTSNLHEPERATPKFAEDADGNLVSKEFVRNALVMGEGICYAAVQDSENKLEANVDARVGENTENEGRHLILAEKFVQNLLVNERMPEGFTDNLDDDECAGNSNGRPEGLTAEFVEDEDGNLVAKEFSCNALLMGEGMCYDAAWVSKDKFGVNFDASIGLDAVDEGNLILAEGESEEFAPCLVMGEGSCYPVNANSKDELEERIDSYIDLGAEDEGGNLIVPDEVVSKSLVRIEDVCYAAVDSKDELKTRIDASIDLHAAKEDCNAFDAENSSELHSRVPLLNYNSDSQGNLPPPCMELIDCDQSEGNLGQYFQQFFFFTIAIPFCSRYS